MTVVTRIRRINEILEYENVEDFHSDTNYMWLKRKDGTITRVCRRNVELVEIKDSSSQKNK